MNTKKTSIGAISGVVIVILSAFTFDTSLLRPAENAVPSQTSPSSTRIERASPTTTTISNDTRQAAVASSTDIASTPFAITSISPSSGPAETVVTLTGSGMSELQTIEIAGFGQMHYADADTFEGEDSGLPARMTFTIPSDLAPGTYRIWIEDQRAGASLEYGPIPKTNAVTFIVTPSSSTSTEVRN